MTQAVPGVRFAPRIGRTGPSSGRIVPNDYAEAVENWARGHGGHAKLKWLAAPMNCWAVILSYRVGDPRQATDSDGEPVLLHDYWTAEQWERRAPQRAKRHRIYNMVMPGNYAYELDELGIEGILARLDRGNILSGRGEFSGVAQTAQVARDNHQTHVERLRATAKDNAGARARDIRRSTFKIPFFRVGIEFTKATKE